MTILAIHAGLLLPALSKAKLTATPASCLSNQKQMSLVSQLRSPDIVWLWDGFRRKDWRPIP